MTEKRFEAVVDGFIDHKTGRRLTQWFEISIILNELHEENEQLKQSNNEAIELMLDGIVEMHDGKRDYAETIFNKAIKLLNGDD